MGGILIFGIIVFILMNARSTRRITRRLDRIAKELAWTREHGDHP